MERFPTCKGFSLPCLFLRAAGTRCRVLHWLDTTTEPAPTAPVPLAHQLKPNSSGRSDCDFAVDAGCGQPLCGTLANLQSVELGFNRENVLLFQLNARQGGHRDPEIAEFYGDLRNRLTTIPGVRQAGPAESSLIGGETQLPVNVPGMPPNQATRVLVVGPEFLSTMQVAMLAGRDIEERDRPGSQPAAVINERFARTNFGDQNPLGRHLILSKDGRPGRDMEIVGVFKNARYGGLREKIR